MPNDPHLHSQPPRQPTRQIRWWWMGLCLAGILWFGSDIYRNHIQPFDEIKYETNNLTSEEVAVKNQVKDRNHRRCQYGAIAIAIGSLALLGRPLVKRPPRQ